MDLLNNIHGHKDLVALNSQQRKELCRQIRSFLVKSISQTGGHLASNLGVVELSVALETVYNTESDRLVFDVGHQSYVHKLLTGRKDAFAGLRQYGAMAGFPKPSESKTDAFVAGHASSSVSIALGMARARSLQNQDYHVVAVIGDGAATGGMSYEGLNDAAVSGENMVIILNDNAMSISPNVGGLAQHLSRLRTKEGYLGLKNRYRKAMSGNRLCRKLYQLSSRFKRWLKRMVLPSTIFDNMGLTYLGPVDGNDVEGLISLLTLAKDMSGAVLIHVQTRKGLGYEFAEKEPARFHGIGKFEPATGKALTPSKPSYSSNFGKTMMELAAQEPQLCAITAAMPEGTGLSSFIQAFPKRSFDVGIAEEHAVSMAGGLAKQGMIPVVALYSTFLQRAYDQILQDVAMLRLHVVFAIDRAGLVGEDGETHHGVFDVGFLRQAPGMTILCPGSLAEQTEMLALAVCRMDGPVAVRYPRGGSSLETKALPDAPLEVHRQGQRVTLVSYGSLTANVLEAAEALSGQGIDTAVLRLRQVHPLPVEAILRAVHTDAILLFEETAPGCGIADGLSQALREQAPHIRYFAKDLGQGFVPHGSLQALYCHCGLDPVSIANIVKEKVPYEK